VLFIIGAAYAVYLNIKGFKEKQRAITKGQSVVFYQGNVVVGGGIIAGII